MRISLSGPHGAGKTTLFEELKIHLAKKDYSFYPDIARSLINLEPEVFSDKKEFEERLHGIHRIRECDGDIESNAVFDRCIWDTFVYADYYGSPLLNRNEIQDTFCSNMDVIFVFSQIDGQADNRLINLYREHAQKIQDDGQSIYFIESCQLKARVDFILDFIFPTLYFQWK